MKNWLFLRWALITSVTCVGAVIAIRLGATGYIRTNDVTNLSFVILAILALMTVHCGWLTFRAKRAIYEFQQNTDPIQLKEIEVDAGHGWLARNVCKDIGIVGTIIGILLALRGFLGFQGADDSAAVQKLVAELSIGMSTALITTLVGIVCAMLLDLQYQNLSSSIDKTLLHANTEVRRE